MTQEQQLKLQALLDGELSEREAREILVLTQRDSAAAALLSELKNTRQVMAKSEPHLSMPESREFFWSKIEREIQRLEPHPAALPEVSFFAIVLRRWIMPAVVLGALVIAGLIVHFIAPPPAASAFADADAPSVETSLANSEATTYRDADEGTTLVWFTSVAGDLPAPDKKPTAVN